MIPRIRSLPLIYFAAVWLGLILFPAAAPPAQAQTPETASPASPTAAAPVVKNGGQLVSIDFNNVDIGVFIKFISDLTQKNFIVDDKVRGKVTIISPGKITVPEAYRVFESVLEVNGYTTVPAGSVIKIVPSPEARSKSIKTRLREESGKADDAVITQIVPLRYADPNEIKSLFTPLISKNSVIQAYDPTNTLIITDVHSNINRLLHILKAIDITGVGQQIAIIPVENASASKMVTILQSIFKSGAKGKGARSRDITFVADERTNVIVVLASEGEVDNVRQLIKTLDVDTPKGQSNIHVYYLENATAEDLVKVLQDIPQKSADSQQAGKPTAPVISNKVRITADKATNSLIITADPEDYLVLEGIIKQVDIPRAMVYIEALIMEVNVTKDLQIGTEWRLGGNDTYSGKDVIYGGGFAGEDSLISGTTLTDGTFIPSSPSGFSLGIFGEMLNVGGIQFPSIQALINAYKKDRDVRILSTPQILTTDNQEAKIYVGKNIPFQTTATLSSSSAGEVYNSYEYRDVGKTLKITPQISKDRMVRLLLSLEVTQLESSVDNRPTTLKRTLETTAIVKDGHSVVLGGLIDDTQSGTVFKVPCLGDIPGLGFLFSTRAKAFDKSNLYIFLTPRVIQNPAEIATVSAVKRNQIESLRSKDIELDSNRDAPPLEELQIPAPEPPRKEETPEAPAKQPPTSSIRPEAAEPSSADMTPSQPDPVAAQSSGKGPVVGSGDSALSHQDPAAAATKLPDSPAADRTDGVRTMPSSPGRQQTETASLNTAYAAGTPASGEAGAPPRALADDGSRISGYTLQVAAIQDGEKARQLLGELTAKGYAAYAVRSEVDGKIWYRLRIGYFPSEAEAQAVIQRLRADQYKPLLIKL